MCVHELTYIATCSILFIINYDSIIYLVIYSTNNFYSKFANYYFTEPFLKYKRAISEFASFLFYESVEQSDKQTPFANNFQLKIV